MVLKPLQAGVGIILIDRHLTGVWMNQRLNGSRDHHGFYQVAGGTVEAHESPRDAAVRELWEETRIRTKPEDLSLVIQGVYEKADRPQERYHSTQFALITGETPENTEPHKHTNWELVPWAKIPYKKTFGGIAEIFQTPAKKCS
jgi:8-oxo-dGTP pyrophosphatase MutT (NUDIX family)